MSGWRRWIRSLAMRDLPPVGVLPIEGMRARGVHRRRAVAVSQVQFLLLPHEDEYAAHVAIITRGMISDHVHSHLRLARTSPAVWGKSAMHAITVDQGFTCHDHIGDGPKGGYMVSVSKHTEAVWPIEELTPEHIAAYRDKHLSALADPDCFLGAWVYEGHVYIDVSRHVTTLVAAMDLAQEHQQIGVFDIAKGITIVTADYFSEQVKVARASSVTYWRGNQYDMQVLNQMRSTAGLPPLVHDTTGAVAKRALRLVNEK